MSKSIFLFIPAIFIVLLLAAISSKYQLTPKPIPVQISPTPVSETTWQTYRNDQYGFEFQYPSNLKIVDKGNYLEVGYNYVYFPSSDTLFSRVTLNTLKDSASQQQESCKDFFTPDTTVYHNENGTSYYKVCDGYELFSVSNPSHHVQLKFQTTADQILSTFKFTDVTPTTNISKNKLLNTSGWQSIKYKNISFKIPKDWIFNETGLTYNLPSFNNPTPEPTRDPVIFSPEDFGHSLVVREYDGGSRRQWYLNNLKEISFQESDTVNIVFKETKLGNLDVLDVILPSNNLIGANSTLISSGKTIVEVVNQDNNQNPRDSYTDTIISTIKFIN